MGGGGAAPRTSRGGRDQFQWGDVAADKDRENYLGHSLLAPVGKWQQGRDLTWYAKDKAAVGLAGKKGAVGTAASDAQTALERERALVKQEEEERRLEALGIRKRIPKPLGGMPQLNPEEAAQLFAKAKTEPTDSSAAAGAASSSASDADRVTGLGFNAANVPTGAHGGAVPSGVLQLEAGGQMEGLGFNPDAAAGNPASAAAASSSAAAASSIPAAPAVAARTAADDEVADRLLLADPSLDASTRALLLEAAAIRAKEARRRERKESKREKKSKKDSSKHHRRHRSRSRSRSVSRSRSRSRSRDRSSDRSRRRHRDDRPAANEDSKLAPSTAATAASTTSLSAAPLPSYSRTSRSRSRSPRDHHHRSRRRSGSRSRSRSRERNQKRDRSR